MHCPSCWLLEGRIDLFYDTVQVCCGYNTSPIVIPVDEFNLDALPKLRGDVRAKIAAGEASCCSCPKLETRDWQPSGLVEEINVHNFTKCNLRCVYCFTTLEDQATIKSQWESRYRASDVVKKIIEAGLLSKSARVYWTGGEPTLADEFDEIIELVTSCGAFSSVFSNCVRYSPGLAAAIQRHPDLVSVLCSVDAGTPETYERIKGADVFEKVWDVVGRYNRSRPAVHAKYIFVDSFNSGEADIRGFVERCAAAGIKHVTIEVDTYAVQANNWQTPERYVEPIASLLSRALEKGFEVQFGAGVKPAAARRSSARALGDLLDKGAAPRQGWSVLFRPMADHLESVARELDAKTAECARLQASASELEQRCHRLENNRYYRAARRLKSILG